MHKRFLATGAVLGGLAVAIGAFGAHGLQQLTSDPVILHSFETGVEYQVYHSLALLVTAVIYEKFPNRWMRWAGTCFIAGILFFSGSLYVLSMLKIMESPGVKWVGPVTPLGGLFFIAGWMCILAGVTRKN
jgi:uncharacterized membrane protein YgdD (TMEM256/DUF423 family)